MYGSLGERSSESDSRERGHERLDRIREVYGSDVVVALRDAPAMGLQQDLGMGEPGRRLEPVGGQLDQQPERILEVDRVHEAAILDPAVLDPALVQPLDGLMKLAWETAKAR